MAIITPYLTFNGTCEEAFTFYKSVFNLEFAYMGRFGDMPPMDGQELAENEKNKIMHVVLPISKETTLMGSDTTAFSGNVNMGNNISISINAETKEEADRLFGGLSAGGQVTMPIADTFWGAYFGMFADKFGIHWMINFDYPPKEN